MDIRELICELGYEDAIVFDNPDFDDAIIGVDSFLTLHFSNLSDFYQPNTNLISFDFDLHLFILSWM